ncbi:MAG: uracil-xanthine permease family protein [Bdellovibrionota bacterium]
MINRLLTPLIGLQMLFVAFGALVLVPILTGLDPSVALFTAGAGTLLFQVVTGRQVPIFLASSFAFIAPIIYGVQNFGIPATMGGLFAAGIVYLFLSALVAIKDQEFMHQLLPPIVVGPVIMVIGLSLAPVAVNMALGKSGDGVSILVTQEKAIWISGIALLTTILVTILGKGLLKLIPILIGVISGYATAIGLGLVNFNAVMAAPIFAVPNFVLPSFNLEAIFYIMPVALAAAVEHIGDMLAIGNAAKKDYLIKPGLHRTLLGDGLATSLAAMLGGPPNTTYSEVTGAVTLTKAFNPVYMTWAAAFAIILSFSGTLGALLATIPVPVMGGIMLLLFGAIAVVGMNTLVQAGDDLSIPRNLIIVSLILVFGIGGWLFQTGHLVCRNWACCCYWDILVSFDSSC